MKYKPTRRKMLTKFGKRKVYIGDYGAYFVKLGGRFQRVNPKPKTQVLKVSKYQTGSSKESKDRKRKALPPGKRRSKSGKVYYENRKNRSDKRGSSV